MRSYSSYSEDKIRKLKKLTKNQKIKIKIKIKIKNIKWKSNYKVTNSFVHRREQRVLTC